MRYRFDGLIFGGAYFRNFTVFKKKEKKVKKKLTGVASETMPQAKPVLMRPEYNIARFCAKLIRSHPSSKGTEQRSKVLLRPNLSIAHPPMGHPKMAPTATKDCKKGKKKGFVWVCCFFFYRNSRWVPLNGACNHLYNTSVDEPWNDEEKIHIYTMHTSYKLALCSVRFSSLWKKKKPFSSFFNSIKVLIFHPGYIYSYYSSIEHAKDSALEILR